MSHTSKACKSLYSLVAVVYVLDLCWTRDLACEQRIGSIRSEITADVKDYVEMTGSGSAVDVGELIQGTKVQHQQDRGR